MWKLIAPDWCMVRKTVFAAAMLLVCTGPLGAQTATVDAIVRSWSTRQAKIETVHVEWTSTFRVSQSTLIARDQPEGDDAERQAETKVTLTPDEAGRNLREKIRPNRVVDGFVEYEQEQTWELAGELTRFDIVGMTPFGRTSLVPLRYTVISRDECVETLDASQTTVHWPAGTIGPAKSNRSLGLADTKPLRWAFRPLFPQMSELNLESNAAEITVDHDRLDGRECTVLRRHTGSKGPELWLDPKLDYAVVRVIWHNQFRVSALLDCSYEWSAEHGVWTPSSWTSTGLQADGAPSHMVTSRVRTLRINAAVEPERFRMEFPAGTIVTDSRSSQSANRPGKQRRYLVRDGGVEREITREESGLSYETLVRTQPKVALVTPGAGRLLNSAFVWVNVILAAILLAAAVRARIVRLKSAAAVRPEK